MVQSFYKNWLLVSKITWGIWTTSDRQWKVQKVWNLMGYFCPKNTFLQLEHYIPKIYLTLLTTTCVKIHQITYVIFETIYKSFFTTQFLCIFSAQTLHTVYNSSPWKCKFSDFPLLGLKFTKFLMSFLQQKVSFFSKFGSFFSAMRDNSSVLFLLKLYMLLRKVAHQSANFQTCHWSH